MSTITFFHYSRFSNASGETSQNKRARRTFIDRNARQDRYTLYHAVPFATPWKELETGSDIAA